MVNMIKTLPDIEKLNTLFLYDPLTGIIRWRNSRGRAPANSIAGSTRKIGYISIRIDTILYLAHRLAWKMYHKVDPENHIDHKNGDKSDNRIENLRDVTNAENSHNIKTSYKNNESGYLGVSISGKRFYTRIYVGGKNVPLGHFDTAEEAHNVYIEAKLKLHPTYIK